MIHFDDENNDGMEMKVGGYMQPGMDATDEDSSADAEMQSDEAASEGEGK